MKNAMHSFLTHQAVRSADLLLPGGRRTVEELLFPKADKKSTEPKISDGWKRVAGPLTTVGRG